MSKYILVDTYDSGELKDKPKYFKQMTGIGPMATPDVYEAMVFDTEEEAKTSPAHRHWSASWSVKELFSTDVDYPPQNYSDVYTIKWLNTPNPDRR